MAPAPGQDAATASPHEPERLAAGKIFAGVIYPDSKKLRQTDQRGLIRRLIEVLEKHGDEDFNCRSGWL